jgi:hypothetical protein
MEGGIGQQQCNDQRQEQKDSHDSCAGPDQYAHEAAHPRRLVF